MVFHYYGCRIWDCCRAGWSQMCDEGAIIYGATRHGGHAHYMKVPARTLIHLPDELSYATGATISCGTAYGALVRLDISARDTVAVFSLGPVGESAVQLSSAMGARVIGIDIAADCIALNPVASATLAIVARHYLAKTAMPASEAREDSLRTGNKARQPETERRSRKISRKLIAETAIAIAEEKSFGAVSISEVARRLNVTPMALYHHVDSKRDIEQLLARHIFDTEVPVVDLGECASWRDAVFRTYCNLWEVLVQNPEMLSAFLDDRFVYSDEHLRHVQTVASAFEMAGIPAEQIRYLCRIFGRIITGSAYMAAFTSLEDLETFDQETHRVDGELSARLNEPLIRSVVAPSSKRSDVEASMNLILDLLEFRYGGDKT